MDKVWKPYVKTFHGITGEFQVQQNRRLTLYRCLCKTCGCECFLTEERVEKILGGCTRGRMCPNECGGRAWPLYKLLDINFEHLEVVASPATKSRLVKMRAKLITLCGLVDPNADEGDFPKGRLPAAQKKAIELYEILNDTIALIEKNEPQR